jgi:hypothetical protein
MSYNDYMEIYKRVINYKNDLVEKWTQDALQVVKNK